jgi:hypothetical protein
MIGPHASAASMVHVSSLVLRDFNEPAANAELLAASAA